MEIKEVTGTKMLKGFVRFPYRHYREDPAFVPDLEISQRKLLPPENPFFRHSGAVLFLAIDRGRIAGRMAAIHNRPHNNLFGENTAFFGFFDVVDDYGVFTEMMEKLTAWARKERFDRLMGPANPSTTDSCGFLVSGFDRKPVIHMPYNKDYYPVFFEKYGFRKAMDLFAYHVAGNDIDIHLDDNLIHRVEKNLEKDGIAIREICFRDMKNELGRLREVYNASNAGNWGFIPLNAEEFNSMARDLKALIPEKLILLAEHKDQPIGFLVAVPDYYQVFQHIPSGRLLPFGLLKYLWYKREINNARILILGVLEKFRCRGIDLLFYQRIRKNLASMGIHDSEAAYVIENNDAMNSVLRKIGGTITKKYRMYYLDL